MRWSDIDWQDGTLLISRSVYEVVGGGFRIKDTKSHSIRRVGLDDLGLAILRRHWASVSAVAHELGVTVGPGAFMFSRSPAGLEPIRPGVVSKFTTRVAETAGVDTHLHALRHFSATQVSPPASTRRLSGRGSDTLTPPSLCRVYSHAVAQRDRELAASLGRTLALSDGVGAPAH